MSHLPVTLYLFFGAITFATIVLFGKATGNSKSTFTVILIWLALQTAVGLTGFYEVTDTVPPRFMLLIGPPLLFIAGLFIFPKGRAYIDGLNLEKLTLLHVIRIPVELALFWLFLYRTIPEVMTFEGRNFDVLSGISALLIWYFGFVRKKLTRSVLLAWNFLCLALLINIVIYAVICAPFTFQQLAFEQPNVAVLSFPFIWLPCCIVPLVLLSHLAAIRQLLKMKKNPAL